MHALTDAGSKYIPEGGASLDGGASLRLKKRWPDEQAGEPEEQRSRPTCCSCGRHVERCRDATGRRAGTSAGRDGTIATALRGSIGHLAERVSRLRIIRLKCRAVGLPWSIALQTRRGIVLATDPGAPVARAGGVSVGSGARCTSWAYATGRALGFWPAACARPTPLAPWSGSSPSGASLLPRLDHQLGQSRWVSLVTPSLHGDSKSH